MTKYNVKKIEITNTMTTTLTTSCKKRDTAINRFCRFLSEYDSCFKDSLLIALMTIHFDCFVDDNEMYKSVTETDEYYMTYTECGDVYQVIIEFKHDENTTYYKSLANVSVSDNTNKTAADNDTKDTESDTNDTNKDTNETTNDNVIIDIGSLDDVEIDLSQETAADNLTLQTCRIKAYYDGKEITIPYNKCKCKECAVEYIHNLFMERVIPYETLFILYYGKHAETKTIENVLNTSDLLQCNIAYVNEGLKRDSYEIIRECFKRLCYLIDDTHKCIVSLVYENNTHDFVILKSRFEGLWTFYSEYKVTMQTPESFARWLYYDTNVNSIELKYWFMLKR